MASQICVVAEPRGGYPRSSTGVAHQRDWIKSGHRGAHTMLKIILARSSDLSTADVAANATRLENADRVSFNQVVILLLTDMHLVWLIVLQMR